MRTATWGMELEWDHQPMEGEEGGGKRLLGARDGENGTGRMGKRHTQYTT